MNIKKIKELVELMNDNNLVEVEVEQEGLKIKLSKKAQGMVEQIVAPVVQHQAPVALSQAEPSQASPESEKNTKEIKAPMVGTFYRAPSPDIAPYVEVGSTVQKGEVICIVEAMKLMNEVKSEHTGKIVAICLENAEAVEFGQTMFVVEPA